MEKRKYKRLDTDFLVRIKHVAANEKAEAEAISKIANLSLGGVFIATPTPLTLNRIVELEFQVPGYSDTVRAKGIVRWSAATGDKQGMGIEFLEVSIPSKTTLANYVKAVTVDELVAAITRTEVHYVLVRFANASWGKTVAVKEIAAETGFAAESISGCVRDFVRMGLAAVEDGYVTFVAPTDPEVLKRLGEIGNRGEEQGAKS